MQRSLSFLALLAAFGGEPMSAASLVLNDRTVHLASAAVPEWDWFAQDTPVSRRLYLTFVAQSNSAPATLFIRQDDVRHDWPVELNGRRIGKLFLMEADLIHSLPIPAGLLRSGENALSILPPKEADDVVLREIWVDSRRLADAIGEGVLVASIRDAASDGPLPSRLTIVDSRGALAPLVSLSNAPPAAVRPGVVYAGNGHVRVGIPAGDYTVYATRGFEWSVATQRVQVAQARPGDVSLKLRREVPTPGLVSCDTHVHTFTHSGHGDATIQERMLTLAGEGLELPIATDHNIHVDYAEAIQQTRTSPYFTAVTGNEVTTASGHFNIFPVAPGTRVPDFRITHWPTLMTSLRATAGVRVIVLNHPRNIHSGFQPFAATNFNAVTGENKRGSDFNFDAIEVLNSSAQQTDYLLVYRDWFALLNYGYRITSVGSSDGHDVSRYIVGQGRTYIPAPDAKLDHIDVANACSNLLAGRVLVSMGLLVNMTVNDRFGVGDLATNLGRDIQVDVGVLGPSWVNATNVTLFANGLPIRETRIDPHHVQPSRAPSGGELAALKWTLPRPAHDVHLVAIATGPAVTAPFWAIPRPYQPASPHWQGRVIGSTNPIWIDGDGDGQFSSARAYASNLLNRYGPDLVKVLPALSSYDETVAAQVASLWAPKTGLQSPEASRALASASAAVRRGFDAYFATRTARVPE